MPPGGRHRCRALFEPTTRREASTTRNGASATRGEASTMRGGASTTPSLVPITPGTLIAGCAATSPLCLRRQGSS